MFGISPYKIDPYPDLDAVDDRAKRVVSKVKMPNSFDLKTNKKKYSLHHVEFPGTWQVDLMFSENNCYLIAIEVNTRYLYAERTNIYVSEYSEKKRAWKPKLVKKSAVAIVTAMYKMMSRGWDPSLIISDSELALSSKMVKEKVFKAKKIKHRTVYLVSDEEGKRTSNHTSLAIVDRVIRTLRKWIYDRGWNMNFLPNDEVVKFVEQYNNRAHRTLSKIFYKNTTPAEVHNNFEKEMIVIQYFLEKNSEIKQNNPHFVIPDGSIVKMYNQPNAFGKRVRIAREAPYEVVSHYNNTYNVKNTATGKIEKAPRIWLEKTFLSKKDLE